MKENGQLQTLGTLPMANEPLNSLDKGMNGPHRNSKLGDKETQPSTPNRI